MRAEIYQDGQWRWGTEDGGWMLGIHRGDEIRYHDRTYMPSGAEPCARIVILKDRTVDLITYVIRLHVEEIGIS